MSEPFDYRDTLNVNTFTMYVQVIDLALRIAEAEHASEPSNITKFVTAQRVRNIASEIVKFAERRDIIT